MWGCKCAGFALRREAEGVCHAKREGEEGGRDGGGCGDVGETGWWGDFEVHGAEGGGGGGGAAEDRDGEAEEDGVAGVG